MSALSIQGLTKRFGQVQALSDITFEVNEGELFGFLGPNGAGKTTTINILTGLARPDSGRIRISGIDCSGNPKAAQHLIGVVPDESNLYPELTGFQNLSFCGALYGIRKREREHRSHELLELFGLKDAAHRKLAGYSKGMKRKLTIAAGIIHRPPILFLDEPTTGIDVASARQIRQLIAEQNRLGVTIFLTTHYIEEAERLCHRIAFIVKGRIVRIDRLSDLLEPIQGIHVMQIALAGPRAEMGEKLEAAFPSLHFEALSPDLIRVEAGSPVPVGPLVRFIEDHGIEVTEARRMRPSLEDVFVRVTGIEAATMRREKEKGGGGS